MVGIGIGLAASTTTMSRSLVGYQQRRILTTRRDGAMPVSVYPGGGYHIQRSKNTRLLPPPSLARLFAAA